MVSAQVESEIRRCAEPGRSFRQIADISGYSVETVRLVLGPRHRKPTGNPRPRKNVFVYDAEWTAAAAVAKRLGYTLTSGEHYGQGSVSGLIEAIGRGDLTVVAAE